MEEVKTEKETIQSQQQPASVVERGNAKINNYRLVKTIGKGHYSKVKLAQDKRTGQYLAIKIIKRHHVEWLSLPTFQKILNNEVHLLQNIQHENIINLIDWNCQGELVITNSGRAVQIFFIVLELVEQGDLFSYIKQQNEEGGFSESYARYYFTQMLDAIEYLHSTAGVVHRDLKPENLLLSHNYTLKIADFGLSARFEGDQGAGIHYSHVGTRQYQAPEVLEQRSYRGDRVDIFSMGVILFTMVTGAMPYLKEASVTDPLYKLILRRCKEDYWQCWRTIRESSTVKEKQIDEEQLDQLIPQETSLQEDISEAVCNCCTSFFSSLFLFGQFIFNLLKFVVTLGQCNDLVKTEQVKLPPQKFNYSQEFKDLVFEMMAYNHRHRPTLEQIRKHPWMAMADVSDQHREPKQVSKENLQKEVIRDMTKVKNNLLVQRIKRETTAPEDSSLGSSEVDMMPTSFRDQMSFQYKTNNSSLNFIYVVAIIGWNKLLNKCYCRRNNGGNVATQQYFAVNTGLAKRKNSDLMDSLNVAIEAQAQEHVGKQHNMNEVQKMTLLKSNSTRSQKQNVINSSTNNNVNNGTNQVTVNSGSLMINTKRQPQQQQRVQNNTHIFESQLLSPLQAASGQATLKHRNQQNKTSNNNHTLASAANKLQGGFNLLDISKNQSSSINNWLDDQIKKERRAFGRNRAQSELTPKEMEGREN